MKKTKPKKKPVKKSREKKVKSDLDVVAEYKVRRTKNGLAITKKAMEWDDDNNYKPIWVESTVVGKTDEESEHEAFAELLHDIVENFGPSYGKYNEKNVYILVAPGRDHDGFYRSVADWAGLDIDVGED